jgi:hypothetical protein
MIDAFFDIRNYGRRESVLFFEEQHKRNTDNGGMIYLVNHAQTQQTTVLAHAEGNPHAREEYSLQLSLADFTLDQMQSQQAHLTEILGSVMKKAIEEEIEWMDNVELAKQAA